MIGGIVINKELETHGESVRYEIYNFLVQFFKENGYAPSVRESGKAVGLSSTSSVFHHLAMLEEMGAIHIEPKKTRAIRLEGYEFVKVR